jgi:hypothetical protein
MSNTNTNTTNTKQGLRYAYEWRAYTDNLNWGRFFLGRAATRAGACAIAERANRGAWKIERRRIVINQGV